MTYEIGANALMAAQCLSAAIVSASLIKAFATIYATRTINKRHQR